MSRSQAIASRRAWSRREVAEQLGVSLATVLRWEKDGLVRTVRIGGTVRVPDAELDRLLDAA